MIDGHCHLDLYPDPDAIVREIETLGMSVISVTTTPSAFSGTSALARSNQRIHTALGLHPQLALQRMGELELFDDLVKNTRFVGEIGLDGAKENFVFFEEQLRVLRHILNTCSRNGGRILTIHSRRAATQVLAELRAVDGYGIPILHWFSGSMRELEDAIGLGVWFSVGRPMLSTAKGRAIVSLLPRGRVITETDGPFVAHLGKPELPWHVSELVAPLGETWGVPAAEVDAMLQENFATLLSTVTSPLTQVAGIIVRNEKRPTDTP